MYVVTTALPRASLLSLFDPLHFLLTCFCSSWIFTHRQVYQRLACIPASSISAEAIFSISGRTLTKHRASLGNDRVSNSIFLTFNLRNRSIQTVESLFESTPQPRSSTLVPSASASTSTESTNMVTSTETQAASEDEERLLDSQQLDVDLRDLIADESDEEE